jgi:hypothetical protein
MLLLIFNELQGKNEPILAFCSRFDGLILEIACCKVVIPLLLLVMLFLRALHSHYLDIVEQFQTRHKSLETMSIDMIIAHVTYHTSSSSRSLVATTNPPKHSHGFLRHLGIKLTMLILFGILLSIG